MRTLAVALLTALTGACTSAESTAPTAAPAEAQGTGTVVEWVGMKSPAPAEWKEVTPSSSMRKAQLAAPKAAGDPEDAEVVIFEFKGGGGVDANLKRQLAVFQPPAGKDKVEEKQQKIRVGPNEGVLQEVGGTFLKKAGGPFDPNAKTTPVPGYKQLYVVFETKDGVTASAWLRGPEKTVEKHRQGFETWVKNFKSRDGGKCAMRARSGLPHRIALPAGPRT
ncbi:MAG TPA: hypothetical protein VH092_10530 [Urbifossiella sp.]|nr:hypothetical protein [Urbifossiella sp.]